MSMNQIPMGTPAGNSDLIGRLASFVSGSGKKDGGSNRNYDIHKMAAQHALESVRSDRQHGQSLERMNTEYGHKKEMQQTGNVHAAEQGGLQRAHEVTLSGAAQTHEKLMTGRVQRHELRTQRSTQEHEATLQSAQQGHEQTMAKVTGDQHTAHLNTLLKGARDMGRAGHVAEFNINREGMSAKFREPAAQPHGETPQNSEPMVQKAPVAAAPASPEPPEPPKPTGNTKAPVLRHPETGKAMKNPDYVKPEPAAPRARKPKA